MITIQEMISKKEMKQFVKFPFKLYKNNKYWVPPIINDELYGGAPIYLSSLKKKYKPKDELEERSLMDRFALHAKEIKFETDARDRMLRGVNTLANAVKRRLVNIFVANISETDGGNGKI